MELLCRFGLEGKQLISSAAANANYILETDPFELPVRDLRHNLRRYFGDGEYRIAVRIHSLRLKCTGTFTELTSMTVSFAVDRVLNKLLYYNSPRINGLP